MGKKLYVGNLAFSVQAEDLNEFFGQFGTVTSAKIIMDRETGRSKGFAFVEMDDDAEAEAAISKGNGVEFQGRNVKVTEALPQESKGPRSGGFGSDRGSKGPRRW